MARLFLPPSFHPSRSPPDILSRRRPNLSFLHFLLISYPVALKGSSRRSPKSASVHRRNVVPHFSLHHRVRLLFPSFLRSWTYRVGDSTVLPSIFAALRDLDCCRRRKAFFRKRSVRTLRLRKRECYVIEYRISEILESYKNEIETINHLSRAIII